MKKVRLFATIASLCLAIGLVVFGVYAVRVGQLDMSSTISYQVSGNLNLEIVVTVEYNGELVTYVSQDANTAYADSTATPSAGYDTINAWKVTQGLADSEDINLTGSNALNLGAYEFRAGVENGATIKYTVTITNKASYAVKLTKTEPTAVTTGAVTLAVESEGLTGAESNQIAGKDEGTGTLYSYTFTATYTLADNTIDLATPHTFAPSYQVSAL